MCIEVSFICLLIFFAYVLPEKTSLGGRHEESTKHVYSVEEAFQVEITGSTKA